MNPSHRSNKVKRLPENTKLTLHTEPTYRGMRVNSSPGPLIKQYLEGIDDTLWAVTDDYTRVTVIRFDLHFPLSGPFRSKGAISLFFKGLDRRIQRDLQQKAALRKNGRTNGCELRYVWVRERNASENFHYHVALFLNYDEYRHVGRYNADAGNLSAMITGAWASAIGLSREQARGLVEFCDNTSTLLDVNSGTFSRDYDDVFFRLSYFAKAYSKEFGDGERNFGCSRRPGRASKERREGNCLPEPRIA
jgi:hypothetical protein